VGGKWFSRSYRRNLVDMHIPDWDEKFLSKFDPEEYVEMLNLAEVKSAMIYANSHVGNCYWPTKTGHMHKGLKGRDILGEIIDLCHRRGMDVVIYYSLIFNNWAYENHPHWRIITAEGKEAGKNSRYGVCCPNSSYRKFAVAQIEELCKKYEFEGIFFDMTFWPAVCYCSNCKKRYELEVGRELPRTINWEDKNWVNFQRKREEWLVEFASLTTSIVKKIKPEVTVEHQSSTFLANWQFGVPERLAEESDYLGGDFYGGSLQESFICKLFYNLTGDMPFEFMTSRCSNLRGHTTTKPKELLEAQTYLALANNGAFLFIDAIDPVGTLNKDVYKGMGEIFRKIKKYEQFLGGKLCQDIGVYFSFNSKINLKDNGKKVTEALCEQPHLEAALGACKSLLTSHIPFGIITKKNLANLSSYQVIILPNLLMIDEEEVKALKQYVASGGNLYASKYTSLITSDGERKKDFLLSDVFGVSYLGETKERITYISPTEEKSGLFLSYSSKYPLSIFDSQLKVKSKGKAKVLATLTLPYTDPNDPNCFASIHSNPPGISTEYPAVTLNEYGKGRVLYLATDFERGKHESHQLIFINLIKQLSLKPFLFEVDAPKSVEVTVFHQEDKNRYLINLVNFQAELPNIPIEGIRMRIRLDGEKPKRLIELPEGKGLTYAVKKGYIEFILPELDVFLMLALEYK